MFWTLAVLILGLGILVISARSAVHSVLFLVVDFLLLVAVLYVTLNAEFVAVIQVLVYAGGIVVLYLFVVMLVNLKTAPERYADPRRRSVDRHGSSPARFSPRSSPSRSTPPPAVDTRQRQRQRVRLGADTPFADCGGAFVSWQHRAARLGALHRAI